MGGPWRSRGFDPVAWRPPVPRIETHAEADGSSGSQYLVGIVVGYVASVVTSIAIMLTLIKGGW
jgi:hypothetical protein